MSLTCHFCKKDVPYPHFLGQRYCNTVCRYEAAKVRQRIYAARKAGRDVKNLWKKEKPCALCETVFVPKVSTQKFCSKTCAKDSIDFTYVHKNFSSLKKKGLDNLVLRWLKLRVVILDRDSFTCKYCGRSPMKDKSVELHVDHKIPRNRGGTDDLDNLITSCEQCNLGKGDVLLEYWKNKKS